jgi:hypothetical protein
MILPNMIFEYSDSVNQIFPIWPELLPADYPLGAAPLFRLGGRMDKQLSIQSP